MYNQIALCLIVPSKHTQMVGILKIPTNMPFIHFQIIGTACSMLNNGITFHIPTPFLLRDQSVRNRHRLLFFHFRNWPIPTRMRACCDACFRGKEIAKCIELFPHPICFFGFPRRKLWMKWNTWPGLVYNAWNIRFLGIWIS